MRDAAEDEAPAELPDELVIDLHKAIDFAGETLTQITVREPTFGQLEEMRKKGSSIFAISLISGVPEQAIAKMMARDVKKAGDFLALFT
ncbi:MAG TPA: phage tail assembly protein [Caulobacteraceae bacterium]|nr:phage tail assembly protein [Caulobacteraceae bacterium]